MSVIENLYTVYQNVHIYDVSSQTKVLVVTKGQSIQKILPLIQLPHLYFGENKVQEALAKWIPIKQQYKNIKLHMIGHLQTNKIKQALSVFDVLETIDRPELAKKLSDYLSDSPMQIPTLLIQINIGEEIQKHGIAPQEFHDFFEFCTKELNIPIHGIMCIPPKDINPTHYFKKMKNLQLLYNLPILSMGMSNDYIHAIKHGSTQIRIGSKIFST